MLILMQTPQSATVFEFLKREYKEGSPELVFTYRVHFENAEPIDFTERILLPDPQWTAKLPGSFIEHIVQDLHLVLGVSYYKLFCPREFKSNIRLSKAQADFWNILYKKGLGEFLYRNNLNPDSIAVFYGSDHGMRIASTLATQRRSVLVGIGGGKDSVVSLELLKDYKRTGFVVETGKGHAITDDIASIAGVEVSKIKRMLDPQVIAGVVDSYNGHVPVSAIYAFLGVLQASIEGHQYIVVSNEHSSNFGNLMHEGNEVNHKWSGSVEFEEHFQTYVRTCLTPNVTYFSLTRPFFELRVVKHFTEVGKKYFHAFSSCNRNFTHHHDGSQKWCGECPKCAFAFLMLAAFLPQEEVVNIFKKDLFEDRALLPLFKDLLGYGDLKPFDCVGTFDESRVALSMASKQWSGATAIRELMPLLDGETLSEEVFKTQQAKTVPSRFRMLGMESALILGYGREGKATEQYLKMRYPHVQIGITDQNDGEDYLEKQHEYDITIKTPSIPSEKIARHYTTATNFFFTEVPLEQIIGITGSKGKSTTATLIYLLLKKAEKQVRLVGNIGVPAHMNLLEQPVGKDELFVFELSSYQLQDLDVSPHIAVVTSLFPEHLDHHGSLERYFDAKRNIVRFQDAHDVYVHAEGFPLLTVWGAEAQANVVTQEELPFAVESMSLRGAHMRSNVALAYTVGKMFGVTDADAKEVVNTFAGLPHRLMHVGTFKNIAFYDDSISTTPESAIAGIRALGDVDTIILGGVDRGYDFASLERELHEAGISTVILFPESGEHMLSSENGFTILHTSSMDEAVQFAYAHTQEGKSCLLSPAAPSYNLFTNFEERGKAFIDAVRKYGTV